VILSETGKADKSYTASLSGTTWAQGKVVKYAIDIDEVYELELKQVPTEVDAHYIISTVSLSATTLYGRKWKLEVDNNASVLFADDANEFIKDGYWTDTYLDSGKSARGSATLEGDINDNGKTIYVMIPENSGDNSRSVTLTLTVNSKTVKTYSITQLAALNGWEQIDEGNKGEFGFNWERVAYYIFPFSYNTANIIGRAIGELIKAYCKNIITNNGASSYTGVYNYTHSGTYNRYYIEVDYSKLSNIEGITDNDGHANTLILKNQAGSAATNDFENILSSSGFVQNDGTYPTDAPDADNGKTNSNTSAAIGECLKKNRYNLVATTLTVNGTTTTSYNPTISDDDVHWYLPAKDEFKDYPSNLTPADCWSSTTASDGSNAYDGAGNEISRSTVLSIRTKLYGK
jgi:hypothetical protein